MERDFSVNFGQYNTWSDWGLIPADRPVVAPPTQKTHDIEIPGGHGVIDGSTALTRYPLFNNREGSWDFYMDNDREDYSFMDVYSRIMGALQGKNLQISLEEDPDYFYDGKCWVTNRKQSNGHSLITLNYSVYPYKHRFVDVGKVSTVDINGRNIVAELNVSQFTQEPVCPRFVVKSETLGNIKITFQTATLQYNTSMATGTWVDPMIMYIPGEHATIIAEGIGSVGIQAAGGWL